MPEDAAYTDPIDTPELAGEPEPIEPVREPLPGDPDYVDPMDSPAVAEHPELAGTIFADNDEDIETSFASTSTALSTEMGEDARDEAAADPDTIALMESIVPGSSEELTRGRHEPIVADVHVADDPQV